LSPQPVDVPGDLTQPILEGVSLGVCAGERRPCTVKLRRCLGEEFPDLARVGAQKPPGEPAADNVFRLQANPPLPACRKPFFLIIPILSGPQNHESGCSAISPVRFGKSFPPGRRRRGALLGLPRAGRAGRARGRHRMAPRSWAPAGRTRARGASPRTRRRHRKTLRIEPCYAREPPAFFPFLATKTR